ncbi:antibiotic biosynthesis monooxygenase [Emcibacter sp. SYSU 3D8]|uniref:putative quinol monooxygenase n=1 Tax=Emcibacter sp. SYSU 3D8 TaxID=3133969 RepID=UPI0031FF0035
MFGQLIRLKVKHDKVAEFEALVSTLVANIRANEPEPKTYEVRRGAEPLSYVYFISFPEAGAYQNYADAPYHRNAAPAIMACLDGDPVYETLEAFY